jgi:multidrug efflux pump subunit AcrB
MSHAKSDAEMVRRTHNTARFFTETRHVSWVLLVGTVLWGFFGYRAMPQRKDPDVSPREALAIVPWPGASAEKIEQLVTRKVEEKVAENSHVETVTSNTRTGVTFINMKLTEAVPAKDRGKEFDDIKLKLDNIRDLPDGAGPINFVKDFGDTATLLLTVASPRLDGVETELRARAIREALAKVRGGDDAGRAAVVVGFPETVPADVVKSDLLRFAAFAGERRIYADPTPFYGAGFVGLDGRTAATDDQIRAVVAEYIDHHLRPSEIHPDVWMPMVIRAPETIEAQLKDAAGDKYTYRQLRDYTDLIKRTMLTVPQVGKVTVSGVLGERIYLDYSQERLAAYGLKPETLDHVLAARNITLAGGMLENGDKNVRIDPSGELQTEKEIGEILVPVAEGRTVYLRDLVDIARTYDAPPRFLNFYGHPDGKGGWQRTRAVTLSIQMRSGQQIAEFDRAVDTRLDDLKRRLPEDLVMARTSDQPQQVEENVHLFMNSLYEAVFLVVLVSLIGFWEWRSALLMALSIPITLCMTFGFMYMLGVDLQQVSIASLIIALGLLVDDPVVAGDAIKRGLAHGQPPVVAAWLGPTRLATAILYATITNIAAYLPFLMLTGDTGNFLYSLPVVIAASLVASRVVSMTFIPLLGYYLLRPKAEPSIQERRRKGFASFYYRVGTRAIEYRWRVLAASIVFLMLGGYFAHALKPQFFPKDLSYLSYVDVWLPEDAPLAATRATAAQAEDVIREVTQEYGAHHPGGGGKPRDVLRSLTSFLGGGAPRFWASVVPEQTQTNYAQILIEVADNHDTQHLIDPLQRALSARVPGATIDVRQLETGAPVGIPLAVRFSGEDISTLRRIAGEAKAIFRSDARTARVRDNWGSESFAVKLQVDPDKASLSGLTNLDVAASSAVGMNGRTVSKLREGDQEIPIVARLRMDERAGLSDVRNLYVHSLQGMQKAPLELVSHIAYGLETDRIQRRNQFRTVTVQSFTQDGTLPSEVLKVALPKLKKLEASLPPGYRMEIGGEYEEQVKGFKNLAVVMGLSVMAIFLALVIQFRHAIKPLIVFAAIPYGMVGAFFALWIMGMPFGFTGFLGIASLVGVIVSHVIVLFDFIEEAREQGESLREALLDAGIMRLRPVLITVGATVIALFPLAAHGGPLWEPLCYAQIGGLTVATFVTLLLVPVLYAIAVLDLKVVRWEQVPASPAHDEVAA